MSKIKINTGVVNKDLSISDGRSYFWQWDTGCKINLTGLTSVDELHFFREGMNEPLTLEVYEQGNQRLCNIPDELLQTAEDFEVYAYIIEEDGNKTIHSKSFDIKPRPKPVDYVYTETEVASYIDLEKRVEKLEIGGGGSGGVVDQTYNPESPYAQSGKAVASAISSKMNKFAEVRESESKCVLTAIKDVVELKGLFDIDIEYNSVINNPSMYRIVNYGIVKSLIENAVGDIDTALDEIIEFQNNLIGGDSE